MEPQSLVSVIIPNFNHADHLSQRLDSVLNQTYQNIQVIILDDCSSDGSREVIEKYRDHPLVKHIVYNESNSGSTFKQWKKGLTHASGDWVWIAESDDYADEKFLESMLLAFKDLDNLGLIFCDSNIVVNEKVEQETFSSRRNKRLNTNRWSQNYTNNGKLEIQDFLLAYGSINNTSAVLFKRAILSSVNPFDLPFRFMGDKYAFVKVLSQSDVGYVGQALNYYRASADAKPKHTKDYFDYFCEEFWIFDWVEKNIKTLDQSKVDHALKINTQLSFFSLTAPKLRRLKKLYRTNKKLLLRILKNNMSRTLMRAIKNWDQ